MSQNKSYSVMLPYALRGHVFVTVEAGSEREAQAKAVAEFKAGHCDEDIGVNTGSAAPSLDESLIEVTES